MIGNDAQACEAVNLLVAGAKANTAAATGLGVDISKYEGSLVIVQNVGTVTAGSITGALQQCDDAAGTNAEAIGAGVGFVAVTTANDPLTEKVVIPAGKLTRPFLRYIGTIVTGPADVGVTLLATPKYV